MKKVYQTIVDPEHGNCMQAAVASLFELKLDEVPNFIELGHDWFSAKVRFAYDRGYDWTSFHIKNHWEDGLHPIEGRDLDFVKECLKVDGGVNGYFYAVVASKTYPYPGTHAVVVDMDLNVVHDPNPNERCLSLTPDEIISVTTNSDQWYIQNYKIIPESFKHNYEN